MKKNFLLFIGFIGALTVGLSFDLQASAVSSKPVDAATSQVATESTKPEVKAENKSDSKAESKPSSTGEASPPFVETPNRKEISGVVRIIRANPMTEVFFKDFKDSVIIPADSKHNRIYEACETSRKKGTPVKLIIDPISRRVVSLPDDKPKVGDEKSDSSSEMAQ